MTFNVTLKVTFNVTLAILHFQKPEENPQRLKNLKSVKSRGQALKAFSVSFVKIPTVKV